MIRSAAIAALVIAAGCTGRDTVAVGGADGGVDVGDYCDGSGPPLLVGGDGSPVCSGDLATRAFDRALCACAGSTSNGAFTVDSFDSRTGPYQPGEGGGDVGMNDKLDTTGAVDIGGDLEVAGGGGVLGGPTLAVGGGLRCVGPLGRAATAVTVGGDAAVGGDVELASLDVAGTFTTAAGATVDVAGTLSTGATATGDVDPSPPCDCSPGSVVDVAALVEAHRYANDNAAIALDPLALADVAGDAELALPCGRYFLDRLQGQGDGRVSLRASGRVALFIGQGITLDQELAVELEPGAEIDLFIAGHVNVSGFVTVGSAEAPTRTRVYVGGAGSLNLAADATFAGNLYAPLIDLVAAAPVTVFGSAFVNRVNTSTDVDIHYDRAVSSLGDLCVE